MLDGERARNPHRRKARVHPPVTQRSRPGRRNHHQGQLHDVGRGRRSKRLYGRTRHIFRPMAFGFDHQVDDQHTRRHPDAKVSRLASARDHRRGCLFHQVLGGKPGPRLCEPHASRPDGPPCRDRERRPRGLDAHGRFFSQPDPTAGGVHPGDRANGTHQSGGEPLCLPEREFHHRGRDARILDVGKALRGEDDADVLLA